MSVISESEYSWAESDERRTMLFGQDTFLRRAFDRLHDSHLVVRFQRACGVVGEYEIDACGNEHLVTDESHLRVDQHLDDVKRIQHGEIHLHDEAPSVTNEQQIMNSTCQSNKPDVAFRKRSADVAPQKHSGDASNNNSSNNTSNIKPTDVCDINSNTDKQTVPSRSKLADDSALNPADEKPHVKRYKIVTRNQLLFWLFYTSSALGNEPFYITFYPFIYWNVDSTICRRMVYFWSAYMFIGQAAKDWIRIPRPRAPPVVRFDKWHALEYGFPSTHSMVGFGIPVSGFYMVATMYDLTKIQFCVGVAICLFWIILVGASRIYLGMHSLADVIGGTLLMLVLSPPYLYVMNTLDAFVTDIWWAPPAVVMVTLGAALCYPRCDRYSPARGETTLILGCGAGIACGVWACARAGYLTGYIAGYSDNVASLGHQIHRTFPHMFHDDALRTLARFVVGAIVAVGTRAVVKVMVLRVACRAAGTDPADPKVTRQLPVELPVKYVTYFMVAFNSTFTAISLFNWIGIARDSFASELRA